MNRAMTRGMAAYELLMQWRTGGRRSRSLISALSAMVRDWRYDDQAAGRVYRARIYNPNTGRRAAPPQK